MAKGRREERRELWPPSGPALAPLAQPPWGCQGWRAPGGWAATPEHGDVGKAPSAPGFRIRLQRQKRSPSHSTAASCQPRGLSLPAPGAGAGSPPLSPLWGRLSWGQLQEQPRPSGTIMPPSTGPHCQRAGQRGPDTEQGVLAGPPAHQPQPCSPRRGPSLTVHQQLHGVLVLVFIGRFVPLGSPGLHPGQHGASGGSSLLHPAG